jgi:hypothetical protein
MRSNRFKVGVKPPDGMTDEEFRDLVRGVVPRRPRIKAHMGEAAARDYFAYCVAWCAEHGAGRAFMQDMWTAFDTPTKKVEP